MKKNLLSVLILALLLVNVILTAIMMFSVTSTNKKTAAIITQIASVLDLNISAEGGEEETASVSIEDTQVYDIADELTIPLKAGADGKDHYAIVSVSLSLNTKSEDYKTYGATMDNQASLIKGEIIEAFGSYTVEELKVDESVVREDILKRIQSLFGSDFVYKISFRGFMLS